MYSDSGSESESTVTTATHQGPKSKRYHICTYPACSKRFETEKEMKYHKVHNPDHYYCKKCDVDCEDWEALTQHKADAMQPWLEGKMKGNKDESPKHIVCEFCGQDFKSFGGRKLHREQNHRADQSIVCQGCKAVFVRASNLIAHYEKNQCPNIAKQEFFDNVQQKKITAEIWKNPGTYMSNLDMLKQTKQQILFDEGDVLYGVDTERDPDEGGVAIRSLLDDEHPDQKLGHQPLPAEVNLVDVHGGEDRWMAPRKAVEAWPNLPGKGPSDLAESARRMSLNSTASIHGSGISPSESASQVMRRRGGVKVHTESYSSLTSPSYTPSLCDDNAASEVASTSYPHATAWTTGQTSKALFGDVKPANSNYWQMVAQDRADQHQANDQDSLTPARYLDINSNSYDPDAFFNYFIHKYQCPIEGCDEAVYSRREELTNHISAQHMKTDYTCPSCFKRFKTGAQLIDHAESGGKCKVKKGPRYAKLLDEVSGGYLKVEHLQQPKIHRREKKGEKEGVMDTKYTGKLPHQR